MSVQKLEMVSKLIGSNLSSRIETSRRRSLHILCQFPQLNFLKARSADAAIYTGSCTVR